MNGLLKPKYLLRNSLLPYLTVCAMLWLLPSCHSDTVAEKYTIGFSQCTNYDNWRQTMLEEMKRELSFHNNVQFVYKDALGDSKRQSRQIDTLLQQHIDLLIVSPNEVKPLTASVQKVYAAGVPVVFLDRRVDSANYTAFVGASNYEVGQDAGKYAITLLKGKGNIIEVAGLQDASPFIARHRGFTDAIAQQPGIHVLQKIVDDSTNYKKQLEASLRLHPDIDLIFAHTDFLASNVFAICKKLGLEKQIHIMGVDGLPAAGGGLDMVAGKTLTATVLYPTGGQEAIRIALNILEKKPFEKENTLVTTVIDSTNVRIMKMQNKKVIAQQKDIDRRQKTIEQQQAIARNQSLIIYGISIILALGFVLGGILFYSLRENKKINTRLVRSLDENQEINTKLAQQNEEISEQRNQLIELGKKAEEANEAKINFFTHISHEFRTPLTLILAPLDEMKANPKLDVKNRQYVDLIQRNTLRLLKLINELMDFRKIEADKMQLQASENDVVQFIEEIVGNYKAFAKRRNIDVRLITRVRELQAWFDVSMMDKVVFNLLSNAFKFTKDGGFIYITIHKDDDKNTAVITVEDNGIGMSEETAMHVFEPFYQGSQGEQPGSGLGLSLAKELIGLHFGNITVKSKEGKGTTFTIMIPLGDEHYVADQKTKETVVANQRLFDEHIVSRADTGLPEPEPSAQSASSENAILVIEDNPELRRYLVEKLGHQFLVMEADNGTTGVQLAFDNVPDLIISDVAMPGKDGFALTNLLKSDVRTSHIPIILLTAKTDIMHQIEGMKSKADAYVMKPFDYRFLEETIRSVMKNREILREHYTSELPIRSKAHTSAKIDKKFVNDFAAVVESNIDNDAFSADDICKSLGVSRIQLYRKIKALLDVSVNDYIISARLQKAKYLLANEDLTISQVADKTGFSSQAYFATVFKNKTGKTPKEFREKG